MNAERQYEVRNAILNAYRRWLPSGVLIQSFYFVLAQEEVECITQLKEAAGAAPNPTATKIKPLKTFPDYCDPKSGVKGGAGPFTMEQNCAHTKIGFYPISVGVSGSGKFGPIKGSAEATAKLGIEYEHVISQHAKEDDYTTIHGVAILGAEASAKVDGKVELGPLHASGHGDIKVEAAATVYAGWKWNAQGEYMGREKGVDLTLGVSGKGSITAGIDHIGDKTFSRSFSATAEGKLEVFAAAGNEYQVTAASFNGNLKKQ